MNDYDSIRDILEKALEETKVQLDVESRELAQYTAERALILSSLVGQPGYNEAVIAERDNVLLKAGILGASQSDGAQQRIIGIITGVLGLGAQVLAG